MDLFGNTVLKPSGECIQCGATIYQGSPHFTCPSAKARRTDPATSLEAARQVERSGRADSDREICLNVVKARPGMTAGEIAEYSGLDRVAVGRRLPELRDRLPQLVRNGDQRRCRILGTRQLSWWPA